MWSGLLYTLDLICAPGLEGKVNFGVLLKLEIFL